MSEKGSKNPSILFTLFHALLPLHYVSLVIALTSGLMSLMFCLSLPLPHFICLVYPSLLSATPPFASHIPSHTNTSSHYHNSTDGVADMSFHTHIFKTILYKDLFLFYIPQIELQKLLGDMCIALVFTALFTTCF